jgi:D-inositol-3-phosphate glycosyltransferase
MRRALLYCTYNGVANCSNGIGRQSQTLLSALENRWEELTALTGAFTPFLAIPAPSPHNWGTDTELLAASEAVLRARGGEIFRLAYDEAESWWAPGTWRWLSAAAAAAVAHLASQYDQVSVIAVDPPFAGTANGYHAISDRDRHRVAILLAMYSTTYIHDWPDGPRPARLDWERSSLSAASERGVFVADVGEFMTRHLVSAYQVPPSRLVPWRSSLDLSAADLQPMATADALAVAVAHDVPLDRPIVLYFGRAHPSKGVDLLIDAVRPLRDQVHLVVIAAPDGDGADQWPGIYRQQIADVGLRATMIPHFTRDLPRALASLPHTRAVACPSRGEPLSNVPFEIALWARHTGPVVVAPAHDGFPEQIADGVTGILYDPNQADGLTRALTRALSLDGDRRGDMCRAAYERVRCSRDVVRNLADTLMQLQSKSGQ